MNAIPPGASGGNFMQSLTPLWHPPIASKWILTVLIVFAGAVSKNFTAETKQFFTRPVVFFLTALVAFGIYEVGFAPGAFAVLFFLLMVWSSSSIARTEGFLNASSTIDWVTNSKRWYVEEVLKERPIAIQDKDVATYPVEGGP